MKYGDRFHFSLMDKIVGTTEAAFLLDISVSRVKVLLQQQRMKGAKKEGRVWKIPLIKGNPPSQRMQSRSERNLEKKTLRQDN